MMTPQISIIIPAKNVEKYIGDCLDSIIGQCFTSWEAIVAVDTNSSDNTLQILSQKALCEPRIRIISSAGPGPSAARNAAIDVARGSWIVFVDADDLLLPGALSSLHDCATSSNLKIILGRVINFADSTEFPKITPEDKPLSPLIIPSETIVENILYRRAKWPQANNSLYAKIFHHSLFENPSMRLVEGIIYEDLEIIPRLLLSVRNIGLLNRPIYAYRANPTSLMHSYGIERADSLSAANLVLEFTKINGNRKLIDAARDRLLSAAFNLLSLVILHPKKIGEHLAPQFKSKAMSIIRQERLHSITNRKSRLRNRVCSLLSYIISPA